MKKLLLFTLVLLLNEIHLKSQELIEIYKKGKVYLEEVADYGNKNSWETLFNDYNLVKDGIEIGKQKRIIVAPDGSVFMSHRSRFEIWKFDKNGNFLKKFEPVGGEEKIIDKERYPFEIMIEGILDDKYIFTSDYQGRVQFFDLDGNYIKMVKLDYLPLQMIPLKNSKIAIAGCTKDKSIITIKDFISGKEKIIINDNEGMKDGRIEINLPDGGTMSLALPYSHPAYLRYRIAASNNGNLLVASTLNGKIQAYSSDGIKLGEADLYITPLQITEADVKSYFETALEKKDELEKHIKTNKLYSKKDIQNIMTQYNNQISKFKDKKFYPEHMPYFSTLIVDSDGNIIVFEYTKEDVSNSFRAYTYDNNGKYICTSSFYSENYELNYRPKSFAINNGYVYALATKNNCSNICLRLVKFKMVQKN